MTDYSKFTTTWAIQMPDGSYAKASPREERPLMWSSRELAEEYMQQIKAAAASIGITAWTGRVVRQYCTPFIGDGDDAEVLVAELEAWMRANGGK